MHHLDNHFIYIRRSRSTVRAAKEDTIGLFAEVDGKLPGHITTHRYIGRAVYVTSEEIPIYTLDTISGFIYHSEIVQTVPPDLRRKVARVVGDKCTLASRVDAQHESKVGNRWSRHFAVRLGEL